VDFYAEADWNLRTDFAHPRSFDHVTEGTGLVFNFGADYEVSESWKLNLVADIQDWRTDPGVITFFLANGTTAKQRLNKVNWESFALLFGATYIFP